MPDENRREVVAAEAPPPFIIAIDGPAGSGKSTVSSALARRLGIARLDTGAMYRAVAWLALSKDVDPSDEEAVAQLARECELTVGDRVHAGSIDVTDAIRSPAVSAAVSVVAAHPSVRQAMVARQRSWIVEHHGGVIEGRDIGTVVAPQAALKVFLTAAPEERSRRRQDEGRAALARRDELDSTRIVSPLAQAPDARTVDTTDRSPEEVIQEVLSWLPSENEGSLR